MTDQVEPSSLCECSVGLCPSLLRQGRGRFVRLIPIPIPVCGTFGRFIKFLLVRLLKWWFAPIRSEVIKDEFIND